MAHFAKLGANSRVIQVLTMDNDKMTNADGIEVESLGQEWLETHNNWPAQMWVQTSYNTRNNKHYQGNGELSSDQSKAFRGNYAGLGYQWDEDNEIFWPKKPFKSWVKDISNASWKAPVDKPALTDEQQSQNDANTHMWVYNWNEETTSWDLTDIKE